MTDKSKLLMIAAALALAALACQTVMSGGLDEQVENHPPAATVAQLPTATPQPSATPRPSDTPEPTVTTPEMRVSGLHPYSVTVNEISCSLSLSAEEQVRLIEFEGDQVRVWHSEGDEYETYDKIGPQRYLRINDAGRPIVVVISIEGYVLEVYDEGADVDQASPCGYFTFTLTD